MRHLCKLTGKSSPLVESYRAYMILPSTLNFNLDIDPRQVDCLLCTPTRYNEYLCQLTWKSFHPVKKKYGVGTIWPFTLNCDLGLDLKLLICSPCISSLSFRYNEYLCQLTRKSFHPVKSYGVDTIWPSTLNCDLDIDPTQLVCSICTLSR